MGNIGQDTPAEVAGGQILRTPQITQHLRRRRRFLAAPSRSTVKRAQPPFRLDHRQPVLVTIPVRDNSVGWLLGGLVSEQQSVRHIVSSACREVLLPETCRSAEACQNGPDQIVLGLAFIG